MSKDLVTRKGRVDVSITHPDGKVEKGYYVETFAQGSDPEKTKQYADEFALVTALLHCQPQAYTELALDETELSTMSKEVH